MREILYRAISLCRGEGWVYGQPRHYASNPHTEKWTIYDQATGIETDIAEETLGQYTGITDKNDKKIFEGDIVAFTFYSDLEEHARLEERPEITENHVILFHDGSFWMNRIVVPDSLTAQLYGRRVVLESLWKHRIEVIGNIYDNNTKLLFRLFVEEK